MRIKLEDLHKPKSVSVEGHEKWLTDIYASFLKCGGQYPTLKGSFKASLLGYGYAQVEGRVTFQPQVPCSRCAEPITWPIEKSFCAKFKPKDDIADALEVDLVAEDLDYYYIEDDSLDVQQVFIDVVVTSLPAQLVKKTEDGKSCDVCGVSVDNEEVYRSRPKDEDSPFAALKNLKLPN